MLTFLVGVIAFVTGFVLMRKNNNFFKTAIKVEGKVTAYKSKQIYNREMRCYEKVYYPIISFTFDGEPMEVIDDNYSSYTPLIGQRRQVGINPQNIQDVRVYSFEDQLWNGIFMLAGLFFIFGGGVVTVGTILFFLF